MNFTRTKPVSLDHDDSRDNWADKMSPRRFMNVLIASILLTVFVPFVLTRFTIGVNSYIAASEEREAHTKYTKMCLESEDLRETAGAECHRRSRLAKVWPVLIALQTVADQTHSCGTISCTDLMGVVVQKIGSVFFSGALAIFLALLAWNIIQKFATPFAQRAMRGDVHGGRGLSRMESVYRQPLPAQDYDHDDFSDDVIDTRQIRVLQPERRRNTPTLAYF